jgi:hypothetical protein
MERHYTRTFLTGAAATVMLLLPVTGHAADQGQVASALAEADATRSCFMEPARWNEALDGPVPLCLAGTPTSASTARESGADTTDNSDRP